MCQSSSNSLIIVAELTEQGFCTYPRSEARELSGIHFLYTFLLRINLNPLCPIPCLIFSWDYGNYTAQFLSEMLGSFTGLGKAFPDPGGKRILKRGGGTGKVG